MFYYGKCEHEQEGVDCGERAMSEIFLDQRSSTPMRCTAHGPQLVNV